jgi:ketosteroid isomerase-like protein
MIRAAIARRVAQRAYDDLGRGDPRRALAAFARDGVLRFAGQHSWAADTADPAERRLWFERFAEMRPRLTACDVLVAGPPWNMRMAIVFDDEIADAAGEVVYRNHGVQYAQMRWGRLTLDEINLDTQRVADFDRLGVEAAAD